MKTNTTSASIESRVLIEQLKLLYDALPISILATLVNALILSFVLSSVIDAVILLNWFSIVVGIGLFRFFSYFYFKRNLKNQINTKQFLYIFNVGSTASAITWGFSSFLLFVPAELGYQVFLAFVVAGMSAGAVSSLSILRFPIYSYLCIVLIPLSVHMFYESEQINIAMGIMTILFMFILFSTATRTFNQVRENILLRFEAAENVKVIRQSEEKYRTIFEAAPVGIIQYDATGTVLNANLSALRILAETSDSLIGRNLKTLGNDESFETALHDSLHGEFTQYNGDAQVINPNVELPIRVYFTGLKDYDDHIAGGVAIIEDVAEQRRVDKLKSEFISTVSHELRTPLTAIKGSIDLLEHVAQDSRPGLIDILKRNTDRLIHLITDILDIDKIAAGSLTFDLERLDVMALVQQAVDDNQGYAAQHKTELKIIQREENLNCFLDKNRFLQVMANLLSNAAKFTNPGTVVSVGVSRENDYILIKVKDCGDGIPSAFQEKLFDKFTQADSSSTRKNGGAGLGLYITKQLVEAMNGKIRYETTPGSGTEFTLEFFMQR